MKADLNSISITGMSYILNDKCGMVSRQMYFPCLEPKEACRLLEAQGVVKAQPKNFGRFDSASLMTYASVVWACVDAGLPFAQGKQRIGIVGSSLEGALDSNQAFFVDYVNAGRNSARSNLFAYTLPTTPLAEAALFCGFTGPVWHMYQPSCGAGRLLEEAGIFARQDDIEAMLAVWLDSKEVVCFVVQNTAERTLFSTSFVREYLEGVTSVQEIVQALDGAQTKLR